MSFPFDPGLLLVVTLTFLLAGFIKGVVGLGLPTVAMGMLTLVLAPAQAATLLIIPSLVTNVWQLLAGPRFVAIALRLSPMMAGIVVGTLIGTGSLRDSGAGWAVTALGIALMVYAILGLSALRFRYRLAGNAGSGR